MTNIEIYNANMCRLQELAIAYVVKQFECDEVMFEDADKFHKLYKESCTILHKAEKLMVAFQDRYETGLDGLRDLFEEFKDTAKHCL